jgi:hypothetical protein
VLLLLSVGIAPQAQEVVVDETHAAKGAGQQTLLLVRRIKAVPVGSFVFPLHVYAFFFSARKVATHSKECGISSQSPISVMGFHAATIHGAY